MATSYAQLEAPNNLQNNMPPPLRSLMRESPSYYWQSIPHQGWPDIPHQGWQGIPHQDDAYGLQEGSPLPQDDDALEDVITTGWDRPLLLLLVQGLISIAWGAALCVFVLVRVPIAWNISQLGNKNPATTNTIVTLVATLSTLHITYILQKVIKEYSRSLLLSGFTLGHLTWLQGVTGMSIFTKFPDAKRRGWLRAWPKRRLLWIVVYGGFAVHSSSLVDILQPHIFFGHVDYYNPIPCGVDISNLTLGVDPYLTDAQQQFIDSFSLKIGMQLASYGDQVDGNTTTAIAGRVFAKDSYAYGAIGGLINGLQNMPGVLFSANCSGDPTQALAIWQLTFSNRSLPTLSTLPDGSRNITDTPVPPQIGAIASDAQPFNLTTNHAAMYALVEPTGSGAVMSVAVDAGSGQESTFVCSWQALPKIVHVQMVNFIATALDANDTDTYPSLAGRATQKTLEAMAQAARLLGASLQGSADLTAEASFPTLTYYYSSASTADILETMLADGGKASLTAYNTYEWLYANHTAPSPPLCDPQNRTVQEHWRFGNTYNLGWIATVWTTGVGVLAVYMACRLQQQPRMPRVSVLEVAQAFALGRDDVISDYMAFHVKQGRIVEKRP